MRTVEERIVLFNAKNLQSVKIKAKKYGLQAEFNYKNNDGNIVYFEFIDILDILELGVECEENEVCMK